MSEIVTTVITATCATAALFATFALMARLRASCGDPERCASGDHDDNLPRCGACPRARTEARSHE